MKILKQPRSRLMYVFAAAMFFVAAAAVACSSSSYGKSSGSSGSAPAGSTTAQSNDAAAGVYGSSTAVNVSVGSGPLGNYLTGPNGHTLYVFLKDAPNTSNCSGGCQQVWPPLLLQDGETVKADGAIKGTLGSIATPAGKQVTYNGAPLYYYAQDDEAGDTYGNLLNDVWFVARPDTASTSLVGVGSSGGKTFLVGPTGMTLYLFAKDTEGVSNCSGQCLATWPALTVPAGLDPTAVASATGKLGIVTRDDGSRQVTYNGLPVYYYKGDKLPGDTAGDGVGGVWSIAKP